MIGIVTNLRSRRLRCFGPLRCEWRGGQACQKGWAAASEGLHLEAQRHQDGIQCGLEPLVC